MTYLSRVRINPLRAESRRLLASPRAMHGAVQGGLPGESDERVLWRLDADNPRRPHLIVLTPSKPDWTHVIERAGWPEADGEHALVRDYAPLLAHIATGREYAFRLTANPVQNTTTPLALTPAQADRLAELPEGKKPRGFRLAHRTAAAQLGWFLDRAERWGFEVPKSRTDLAAPGLTPDAPPATEATNEHASDAHEVRITARHRHSFLKGGQGAHVTFHSATFEGHLRVTDPEALTARLLGGIGPAKAYGCGLLTLAPVAGVGNGAG
ncbi:type I-E CRISPR-associated protein Cas6/Cse3/CasE [Streptomyces buecherae]|uniref:type I-E CRISPR-associated protein Cas6/Cse3/CasE n=2 Tax=Streptomyces buecherae TaxID=2763006 RepID=UPI00164CF482|nr:type I-E CRISPR-associated protein Cas6/Cse3/CasE [Streptomyces buecherae]QNJ41027.1 type I-E CRISPR-associated protein Cas6/Cse3/CasE [Streptomyces buecherae]